MPGAMEFGLLGPLVVRSDAAVIPVRRGKQRAVLAALLLEANKVVPVEAIAEVLWGPEPPPSAPVAIRNYVRRLRETLGQAGPERIRTQARGYLVSVADDELDVARFERLLASARSAAHQGHWDAATGLAQAALALWRGEPLADTGSDTLALREAPRLTELRLQAVELRLDADLHLGRHAAAAAELLRLTAAYPLREHAHALLMLAQYRCGRLADALAAYRDVRAMLAEQLGIEPGAELRQMHQRVLAADPALAAPRPAATAAAEAKPGSAGRARPGAGDAGGPGMAAGLPVAVPRQLPAAVAQFTGRAAELAALTQVLDQAGGDAPGTVVISAIGGTAGVGKTALALHWAHQMAGRFPGGQLYANLRGFDPAGPPAAPGDTIRGFLGALGVPADRIPPGPDAQAGLYRSVLAGRRMLIVLDNARDEEQVRPLLPAEPGCLLLVTSRAQLTGLAAIDGARLLSLDVLSPAEAAQMLTARLCAQRAAAEPGAVTEIAGLCARLPLALAIAAARAATRPGFPLATLAAELHDTAGRLDALDTGDPAASVRAVFSWSCQQLSPAAARMFRLLGLHPGPDISVPAAASLVAVPLAQARRDLDELTHTHLLAEHSPGRYAFHDLLRAYAAEQARIHDCEQDRQAATDRILDHYLHTAHVAALLLSPSRDPITLSSPRPGTRPEQPGGYEQAMDWLTAEHQVLLAVTGLAAAGGSDIHAWQLPWALETFLDRQGHWRDLAATQRTALAAAERLGDLAGQAHVHRNIGNARFWLSSHAAARAHLSRARDLYREIGDRVSQARVEIDLARLLEHWQNSDPEDDSRVRLPGRYREALGHSRQALRLFREAGHEVGQAYALNAVGWYHAHLGDQRRALQRCQQALVVACDTTDRVLVACIWDSLGYIHHQLGQHADAVTCYTSALSLCRDLGNLHNQAEVLTRLGETLRSSGDHQAARDTWQQALNILDDLHHPDAEQIRAKLAAADGRLRPEPATQGSRPGRR